jgi:SpoVK/Ycf46/Vps4 family AAA+-type ATPase
MQCVKCNTTNRGSAKFCKYCGTTITSQTAAAPELPGVGGSIDELVGLDEIKSKLSELQAILEGMKQNNKNTRIPYNTIIIGASGTGKTFISNLITELFLKFGMITKNKPDTVDGGSLEEMDTDALDNLFENAKGGMLFIDNAHKLVDEKGEAKPCFSKLITKMDSCKNDPIVLMAGLPFGLREFVKEPKSKNITGRFKNIFFISDYVPVQYVAITENELKKEELSLSPEASDRLLKRFRYLYKELKKPDSDISAVNGYLAINEAESIKGAYYMRKASDKIVLPDDIKGRIEEKKNIQEIMAELDSIIGMTELKKEIKSLYIQLNQIAEMEKKGVKMDKPAHHFVITGNPGTGKTTVARLLGNIFEGLGLLESGHVVEVDRSKLVAGYVGQTAPLTNQSCDSAMGGILFIDEAYTLWKNDSDDVGKECIDTLLKRMEDDRGKFMVIAAGYKSPIEQFLSSNDGLKNRFTKYFNLEDYNPEELAAIFESIAVKQHHILPPETRERVVAFFKDRCGRKTKDFANGREARNLMDEARKNQAERLASADIASMAKEESLTLLPEDIPGTAAEKMVSIDEALKDLNELVGLKSVKDMVRKIANTLQAQKLRGETEVLAKHFVFYGNPGTGKTTVARILGNVFNAVGLLPTNKLVEVDQSKLISGYVGQTGPLTNKVCDSAMGGILFIDEAYGLVKKGENDHGQECIDALVKRTEDDRGKFIVIAAGYPKKMKKFLASNEGFKSRFTDEITFEDYNPEDMHEIFVGMSKKKKIEFATGFDEALRKRLEKIYAERDEDSFANARTVRLLFDKTRENVDNRVMAIQDQEEQKREINIMRPEDLDMTVS